MTQTEGTAAGCVKIGLLYECSRNAEFSKNIYAIVFVTLL